MLATLLALADPDRIPNQDAIAMSPTVGWLMVAAFVSLALMFILQSERWRRFWLTNEDPRPIGLFRIVFAFLCICNINDLFEYFVFLFSDEGIFLTDAARQHFASAQLKGFGDGLGDDPHGFFDWAAVLEFFRGPKYSLLFFWDSPAAMWAQMIAFYTVTTLFMIGWRTRLMGVLSFALMNSFFLRNQLFWEGTEVVYRVFFFYLLLARSGHAYSVDNWLRTRKLQKQGLLSVRGGPGNGAGAPPSAAHPQGLQAVYRLIPAWPRNLMMLNLGVLYCFTGAVKNGHVWAKGDALYFALNMDHFHRFYPQEISSIPWVGLGLMRLATWITHWWEALFPFLILGIITRWGIDEKLEPLKGWRLWSVRACWLAFGLLCGAIVVYTLPVHYAPGRGKWPVWYVQQWTAAGWLGLMAVFGGLWWMLGNRPPKVTIRGTRYVLDREWFCKWVLGRRVWLTLGLIFHGNLQVLMNIGMFPPIMMSTYLFLLRGDEPGRILRFFARGLGRAFPRLPLPAGVRRGEPPLPAEDRTLPHHLRDGRRLPPGLMVGLLALAVFGVALQSTPIVPWLKEHVLGYEPAAATGGLHFAYTLLAILATLIIYTYVKGQRGTPRFAVRLAVLVALIVGYVYLMIRTPATQSAKDNLLLIKIGVNAALLLLVILSRVPAVRRAYARWGLTFDPHDNPRRPPDRPAIDAWSGHPIPPWSYGPIGRVLIGSLVIYHVVAIALWVLPEKDCLSTFRIKSRESFSTWVLATSTDQGWGMFAPNPPQHNVFMRVVVTDEDGEQWDLRTDVYAQERHPIPWVWNDRMRKMNRRIIGGEGGKGDWYQEWYARYLCREWALAHRGAPPQKVELYKVSYRMPPPELVVKQGWYSPERLLYQVGRESKQHTTKCSSAEHGQLPNEIRERHGLPLLPDGVFKPRTVTSKKKAWDKRYEPPKEPKRTGARTTPIAPTAKKIEEPAEQPQAEATPAPPVEGPKMND